MIEPDGPTPDPMRDVEDFLGSYGESNCAYYPDPFQFEDSLSRQLSSLEASIEGSLIKHVVPEPLVLPSEPPESVTQWPTSPDPPPPLEFPEKPWITLKPPTAAQPFFQPDGLDVPVHGSRGHVGTGLTNTSSASSENWCPREEDFVCQDVCQQDCRYWQDQGSGYECCYDWSE